jgi:DNA-binding NarL/FixJ family response regulator
MDRRRRPVGKAPDRIRLIVAAEHPILLAGLERLLSQEHDFVVVARCRNGFETLQAVHERPADVLLSDVRLPGRQDGLAVLRELHDRGHPIGVVLLTTGLSDHEIAEAVRLGARGVFRKDAPRRLAECIRRVHRGGWWGEESGMAPVAQIPRGREPARGWLSERLTPREIEVATTAAAGLSTKAIAHELSVAPGTVKVHLQNIYAKLGISTRFALMQWARKKGLIRPGQMGRFITL